MKRIITLLLAISLIFCCNLNTLAFDSTTNTMKVAINAEFPPFEYIENGEYKGFDIDLEQFKTVFLLLFRWGNELRK